MSIANITLKKYFRTWYTPDALFKEIKELEGTSYYIHSLIEKEIKNGISPEKIIIGGSGEGGITALYSAATFPKKIGGIITVSCDIPETVEQFLSQGSIPANKNIPVLYCDREPIPDEDHESSKSVLQKLSTNVESKVYAKSSKALPDEGINDFKQFIKTHTT